MDRIRIATRQSQLALWQANFISEQLRRAHPDLEVELVGMTTKGDQWLQAPLSEIGGKGLFIKELEQAMLDGRADIAVHSVKDLPAQLPDGFDLPVLAYRDVVNDVLVSRHGQLQDLPQGAVVGSSSLRRQAQLLAVRADLQVRPIRGNVGTRLGRLDDGEYDAIVLAAAGLKRLQSARDDVHVLATDLCLPAPGQAALGIECLTDSPAGPLLDVLRDPRTAALVETERGISLGLGADCSLPVAALAQWDEERCEIHLRTLLAAPDGRQILRAELWGSDPDELAALAVQDLMRQGAAQLLAQLQH